MDTLVLLAIIVLIAVILVIAGVKVVPQSETRVIERLGRFHSVLPPGLNIIWPFIDKPKMIYTRRVDNLGGRRTIASIVSTSSIDLREQVYDFPKQSVITKDNVTTTINALLYFQIVEPVKAVYEIDNLPNAIEKLTQTTLRNVIGELELDETLTSRDTINSKLRIVLDEATNKWGVKVNRVELQDITPPESVRRAMEQQMQAERERRAKVLEAKGHKEAMILQSEGEKESQINQAEAERQTQILRAQGEADAKVLQATAEAEAIRKVAEAIAELRPQLADLDASNKAKLAEGGMTITEYPAEFYDEILALDAVKALYEKIDADVNGLGTALLELGLKGKKVAVIGSGMTGLETAEFLSDEGNDIIVVEMAEELAPGTWNQHKMDVIPKLEERGAQLLPGWKLVEMRADSVEVEDVKVAGRMKNVPCDAIIMSLGVRPLGLDKDIMALADLTYTVGDAESAGRIAKATHEAYKAAMAL